MPRLIIFIDKDPRSIWEDLQRNGKVNTRQSTLSLVHVHEWFLSLSPSNRTFTNQAEFTRWNSFRLWIECTRRNGYHEWGLWNLSLVTNSSASCSLLVPIVTFCNTTMMKSNPWMMYEFRSKDWQRQSVVLLQIVFDIEQLNFEDTNKFPDWRLTVDVDVERFRAQYVLRCSTPSPLSLFLLLLMHRSVSTDFKMNISGRECSTSIDLCTFANGGLSPMRKKFKRIWWNTYVFTVHLTCQFARCDFQDPRYYWKTSHWDVKSFFRRYDSWTRLPFY